MNPFLKKSVFAGTSNRFSGLSIDNEEDNNSETNYTNKPKIVYNSHENTFLNAKSQDHYNNNNNNYNNTYKTYSNTFKNIRSFQPVQAPAVNEKPLDIDIESFQPLGKVNKVETTTENKVSFANTVMKEADKKYSYTHHKTKSFEETLSEENNENTGDTPADTLRKLCELYAYQERWGRYWYGDEKYNEMYGIQDRRRNQFTDDQHEHYFSEPEYESD